MSKKIIKFQEMLDKGEELYGKDKMQWKFKCPVCDNVQTAQQFKDIGADPNQVDFNCIGRYMKEEVHAPFGENSKGVPKQPCNYTSGGFLKCNSKYYINPETGMEFPTFEFADE